MLTEAETEDQQAMVTELRTQKPGLDRAKFREDSIERMSGITAVSRVM